MIDPALTDAEYHAWERRISDIQARGTLTHTTEQDAYRDATIALRLLSTAYGNVRAARAMSDAASLALTELERAGML